MNFLNKHILVLELNKFFKANDIDSMRDISPDKISFKANNKPSSKTTLNKDKAYRLANSKLLLIKYANFKRGTHFYPLSLIFILIFRVREVIEDNPSERRDVKLRNQLNSSSNNRSYQNKLYMSGDITNSTHIYNKLREEPIIFV